MRSGTLHTSAQSGKAANDTADQHGLARFFSRGGTTRVAMVRAGNDARGAFEGKAAAKVDDETAQAATRGADPAMSQRDSAARFVQTVLVTSTSRLQPSTCAACGYFFVAGISKDDTAHKGTNVRRLPFPRSW